MSDEGDQINKFTWLKNHPSSEPSEPSQVAKSLALGEAGSDIPTPQTDQSESTPTIGPEVFDDAELNAFLPKTTKLLDRMLERRISPAANASIPADTTEPTVPSKVDRLPLSILYGGLPVKDGLDDDKKENPEANELQRQVELATARLQELSNLFWDVASRIVTTPDSDGNNFQRYMLFQQLIKETQEEFTGLINQFSDPIDSRDSWSGPSRSPGDTYRLLNNYQFPEFKNKIDDKEPPFSYQKRRFFQADFNRMLRGVADSMRDDNSPIELAREMSRELQAQIATAEAALQQLLEQYDQRRNTPGAFNVDSASSAYRTRVRLLNIVRDFAPHVI